MTAYSRTWVKGARRAWRLKAKRHPLVRKELRQRFWNKYRRFPASLLRLGVPLLLVIIGRHLEPELIFRIFLYWAPVPLFLHAWDLHHRAGVNPERTVLFNMPVREDWLLRYHGRNFLLRSLWFAGDATALYAVTASQLSLHRWQIALLPMAVVLQWIAALGISFCLWRLLSKQMSLVLFGGLFALLMAGLFWNEFWDYEWPYLIHFTPAGWLFAAAGKDLQWENPQWLLPAVAAAFSLPLNWSAFRRGFHFREGAPDWSARPITSVPLERVIAKGDVEAAVKPQARDLEELVLAIEAEWRARAWLRQKPLLGFGLRAWILRTILNTREQRLLNLLLGVQGGGWSPGLMLWKWTVVIICGVFGFYLVAHELAELALLFGGVTLLILFLGTVASRTPALMAIRTGQRVFRISVTWPLSYSEMARVLWKIHLLDLLAAFPVFATFGTFCGWLLYRNGWDGLTGALRCWLLVLSWQPLFLCCLLANGTQLKRGFLLRWAIGILMVPLIGVYIAAIGLLFSPGLSALVLITSALCSWVMARLYRLLYEQPFFDLMAVPRN